jgi:hypothetical protein
VCARALAGVRAGVRARERASDRAHVFLRLRTSFGFSSPVALEILIASLSHSRRDAA